MYILTAILGVQGLRSGFINAFESMGFGEKSRHLVFKT